MIADHPALDMLNTVFRTEAGLIEGWQTDEDVIVWLAKAGLRDRGETALFRSGELVREARQLREVVRAMLRERKAARRMDVAALNALLGEGRSHLTLAKVPRGPLEIVRLYDTGSAKGMLARLAESSAELLVTGDMSLVRACEGLGCVLWFYDRTKGHRRRWCSMATCGNRHKVAKFRAVL